MITRARKVNLVLAAALVAAAAASQAHDTAAHHRVGRPGPAAPARGFTLVAAGGVLPDSSVLDRAASDAGGGGYDFRPMLAGVRPVVSGADLAICQLRTVYDTDTGTDRTGTSVLKTPPQVAEGLAATGYDSCSTASSHTLDDGADGVRRTLDALDRAGVRHAGSARSAQEANGVTLMRAGGARVAHLAYTDGTNGLPLPQGQPWAVGLADPARIVADARAARGAGADVVVVSLDWGTEWQDRPDERQLGLARRLTASRTGGRPDIDLILGTHAHVPQAYEKVNGTWVVYGTGDQVAGETYNDKGVQDPRGDQSTLGRFTFSPPARGSRRWEVTKAEFVPLAFDLDAGRVVDLDAALERGADVGAVRDRIRDVVLGRGAARDGLVMAE
ncbi:CapA family protein [Streptomyces triticiradicis]|uniref:CapA family protein n=1 Tax=Streptomyces triticiradicis TaxID=2651189 RepID=A0A7J5D4P8_9ACTN|nr:CapA family protein [Streptomyces triticiradicis]KAB1977679.1 CapA family protein [Streptomyces triticiradicis]